MNYIFLGGRTEETAVNIATLSGSLDLAGKTFTSASNFMIIKFRSDEVFSYFLFQSEASLIMLFTVMSLL